MLRLNSRILPLCILALGAVWSSGGGAGALRAADDAVALPPFMVEEASKGPPWRYAQSPEFEILSRCDDATTRQLTEMYHRLHLLLAMVLPPKLQVKHDVAKTVIYYDEEIKASASQEVIRQMMNESSAVPAPQMDAPNFGGRGYRGGSTPQRKFTFLPNMRLWDKDAMAVFAIVRPGASDDESMYLTLNYVAYLVRTRTPELPPWFIAGFLGLYPQMKFRGDMITLENGEWISPGETHTLKDDPKKARPLLPIDAFFRGDPNGNNQTHTENIRVWASQAELFVRWGLDIQRRDGFFKFVDRSAAGASTEALLQECMGLDYAALATQLAAFLPVAVRKSVAFRLEKVTPLPPMGLRNASEGEIARIKGDWERLEIGYVRERYPEVAGKYVEQARRTMLRAYDHDVRDPRLLASLGLCEIDAGNDAGAREYLEAAAKLNMVRPRAWYELGRLRLAERLAAPASNGKLSVEQVVDVLTPLFTARAQNPPLPEVYELIADGWAASSIPPKHAQIDVVYEGVKLFPRRVPLVRRAASMYLNNGFTAEAAVLIDLGLRVSTDDGDRAYFTMLQGRLPAAEQAK